MKRKIILCTMLIIILTTIICCVACKAPKTNLEKLEEKISTMQTQYVVGNNESFNVSIITCKQEETLVADGKVGKLKEQTLLTLKPKDVNLLNKDFDFKLVGETASLDGKVAKSKIGVELSAEITNLASLGKLTKLQLTNEGVVQEIELVDKLEGMITPQQALKASYEKFQSKIDPLMQEKQFEKEVYIKVVEDKHVGGDNCYWFVSFIQDKENYWSALVDIKDGTVLNTKEHDSTPNSAEGGLKV